MKDRLQFCIWFSPIIPFICGSLVSSFQGQQKASYPVHFDIRNLLTRTQEFQLATRLYPFIVNLSNFSCILCNMLVTVYLNPAFIGWGYSHPLHHLSSSGHKVSACISSVKPLDLKQIFRMYFIKNEWSLAGNDNRFLCLDLYFSWWCTVQSPVHCSVSN